MANGCDATGTVAVRQENEVTSSTRAAVRHYEPDDLILNTGQLRDAKYTRHFRRTPAILDREWAIMAGAAREIDGRRAKENVSGGPGVLRAKGRGQARGGVRARAGRTRSLVRGRGPPRGSVEGVPGE